MNVGGFIALGSSLSLFPPDFLQAHTLMPPPRSAKWALKAELEFPRGRCCSPLPLRSSMKGAKDEEQLTFIAAVVSRGY